MANDITVKRAEPMLPAHYSFGELERMAKAVSASKLFGVKTDAEALSLLLLAQAEGRHPMIAARDYHVIEGKPSLKADAMLARFHEAGGRVEWHQVDDSACIATFSHPQGGSYKVNWTIDDARVPLRQRRPEVPIDLAAWVDLLVARDPAKRAQISAAEVAAMLARGLGRAP